MELKHIYWFAHFNLSCPSTRYRGKYALDYMGQNHKISYDFVYPANDFKNIVHFFKVYLSVLFFRKKNSIIVFQKIRTNRFYAKALKLLVVLRGKNTLYDIDDAEYLRRPKEPIDFFIKRSSCVTAAGSVLEKYCLQYNSNVFKQTSPIIYHNSKKTKRNKKPVIGWVGDYGNGNEIEKDYSHKSSLTTLLFPALSELKFDVKLVLIGIKEKQDIPEIKRFFESYPHVELEIPEDLDWENDFWLYDKIKEFDIGVSPMLDFEFNRAKSAFKSKQYLSCGVPCLASDVGENSKYVNNTNGILCNNANEFKDAIEYICSLSDTKYEEMSEAAFDSKVNFSMKQYCDNLIAICAKMK